jgi:pimeloyl-ACP methyl ester carboxylesterase
VFEEEVQLEFTHLLILAPPIGSLEFKVCKRSGGERMPANVVLVHGADADGSSWSKVIPILQYAGHYVVAVQLPLTSIVDDAVTVRRAIDNLDAPVVVVGHSFGGVVISQAAHNAPNVSALVYVVAFAPDTGESAAEPRRSLSSARVREVLDLTRFGGHLSVRGIKAPKRSPQWERLGHHIRGSFGSKLFASYGTLRKPSIRLPRIWA